MVIQGKDITCKDMELIRQLIDTNPSWGRTRLSRELCILWNWRAASGRLKDMACRSLLLKLDKQKLKDIFGRYESQPLNLVIYLINPILRGWVNYFRIGHSSRCFGYIRDWVEKKIRRHLMHARKRHGFGWNRWSRAWLYNTLGLYDDYRVRYYNA